MDNTINKIYESTIDRLKKDNKKLRDENEKMIKILNQIKSFFVFL